MDDLSKALESLEATLKERVWDNDSSPMPRLGSISAGGNLTTVQNSRTTTAQGHDRVKSSEPLQSSGKSSQSETPIRECKHSQNQLTVLLAQAHLLLKGYGEKAEDAVARDAGFQWLLGRFAIEQVRTAFRQYIERNSDLPAPADIINLIEPRPKRLSAAVYTAYQVKARSGGWLLSDERQFCRDFEAQEMDNGRVSREFTECLQQIENRTQKTFDLGYEGVIE